ncbi:MAG: MBL fold metallo-hydrolase [Thermotogota bacterium]
MNILEPKVLFENENHKFILLGIEDSQKEGITTNQYLIVHNEEGVLLDPGGVHVFPMVLSNVVEFISPQKIKAIFYSHQDPDVSSSISLWANSTNAKFYVSGLWERFLPHFGVFDSSKLVPVKDHGGKITFSDGYSLDILPTHFLHSIGNFTVYDSISKILFSGDIGAAAIENEGNIYVENFQSHIKNIKGFHERYMTSSKACKVWGNMIKKYDVDLMVPQHGLLYKKDEYTQFLNWFENLKCGIDIIEKIYGV